MKAVTDWLGDAMGRMERIIFERLNSGRQKPIVELVIDRQGVLLWAKECYGPTAGACRTFVEAGTHYEVLGATDEKFWRTTMQTVTVKVTRPAQ